MLFTERKALTEMFTYLEEDKRTIKAQARQDIENIENRQMALLDRLQRLDDIERECIDAEGVLTELAATTKELAALIPNVPFVDVLERAAEKIVADPQTRERIITEPLKDPVREKISEAARMQRVNAPLELFPATKERKKEKTPYRKGITPEKGFMYLVEFLKLQGKPLKGAELQKLFEERTGVIYANFHSKIKEWITHEPGKIIKKGFYYHLKELEDNGESNAEKEKTHHEPGNRSQAHS